MGNKVRSIIFMIIGVVSIIMSIVCFSSKVPYGESNSVYGGDAYTGIQNASASTSRAVVELAKITQLGFGSVLLIAGFTLIGVGSTMPVQRKTEENDSSDEPSEEDNNHDVPDQSRTDTADIIEEPIAKTEVQ